MSENWFDELSDLCEVDAELNANDDILDRILDNQSPPLPPSDKILLNSDHLVLTDWFDLSGLSDLSEVDDDESVSNDEILDQILACQTISNKVDEILANSSEPSPQALDEILREIEQSYFQQGGGSVNEAFNQREIRESLSFQGINDPAEFYINVMQILNRFAERGSQIARANDRIQFEINTLHTTHHVNFNYDGSNMLLQIQQLLDKLVQSNEALAADNDFNFRLQVVNNPFGGGKRKIESIVDHELVNIKRSHLIYTPEADQSLCFALSIAGLLNPSARDTELLNVAKNIHHQAGLSEQTPVSFSDVIRFENIVQRKIITFYRTDKVISKFKTDFTDRSNPLFILLLNHHYY